MKNLRKIIRDIISENLDEFDNEGNFKIYHRLSNKTENDLVSFIKNVIDKGLIRHDNGEIGNVIWFSKDYDDYAKNGNFVVAINYNSYTRKKYQIVYDGRNAYIYEDIPFEELEIIKIPALIVKNEIIPSDKLIRYINNGLITSEKLNNLTNVTIFEDIFEKYVQPNITISNFTNDLDKDKIKFINVF
jgi:hypothetical protein